MNLPLVSVIVPMRNAEQYVIETLHSILREEKTPVEVIVVNDKSTDRSLERVLEVRDSRVRVIDGPGIGFAACMNTGLAHALGSIVMQCDADDLYPEFRIREQVSWLEAHPEFEAVCGNFSTIDERGNFIAQLQRGFAEEEISSELKDGTLRTSLCTFAIRSSLITRVGEGFRQFFEIGPDIDLQYRLGEKGRIAYVPRDWYLYRIHSSSMTHTYTTQVKLYFEQIARNLQLQRRISGLDDLQRGRPPIKPEFNQTNISSANEHIQSLLLARAWHEHSVGNKKRAIKIGISAIGRNVLNWTVWKSFFALIVK